MKAKSLAEYNAKSLAEMMRKAKEAGHDSLGIANDPEAVAILQKMRYARTDTYYDIERCAAFLKTKEKWGGLSNMAGGYPIKVVIFLGTMFGEETVEIRSTEALYQACRFPDHPDIQREIIDNKSPMGAKMVAKRGKDKSRPDWLDINIDIMRWCLNLKWLHNEKFRELLAETGVQPIVEISYKDPFWGAKPDDAGNLVGQNVLGKLLMELRETSPELISPTPPTIHNFKLLGANIE